MTRYSPISVPVLIALAPAAVGQSTEVHLPFAEYVAVLRWCHERTFAPLVLLEERVHLLGRAVREPAGSPGWQQIAARLASIEAEYDFLVQEVYFTASGVPLTPLLNGLDGIGAEHYGGWQVPNQSCAIGVLHTGAWAVKSGFGPLPSDPYQLLPMLADAEVDLFRALLDRDLIADQLLGVARRLWAFEFPEVGASGCASEEYVSSHAASVVAARAMDVVSEQIETHLFDMRALSLQSAWAGLTGGTPTGDAQFQMLIQSIDELSSTEVFGRSWFQADGDWNAQACSDCSVGIQLKPMDFRASSLAIDSLDVSDAANASTAIAAIDTAINTVRVARRELAGFTDVLKQKH